MEHYGFSEVNFPRWKSAQTTSAIELGRCSQKVFYLSYSKFACLEKETAQLQLIDQIEGKLRRI